MAAVCSSFKETVSPVAPLRQGICIGSRHGAGPCPPVVGLDSNLLRSWAKDMTALEIYVDALSAPRPQHGIDGRLGTFNFIAAAPRVTEVQMHLGSLPMAAALADFMLAKLPPIKELAVDGRWLPTIYPYSLTKLSLSVTPHPGGRTGMGQQANMALYRLEQLPDLQSLRLTFDRHMSIRLDCSVPLPHLEALFVQFWVTDPRHMYELVWLKSQAAATSHRLDLRLVLELASLTDPAAAMRQAAEQVAELEVGSLTLELRAFNPIDILDIWSACQPEAFQLVVRNTLGFSSAEDPLRVLPHGCQSFAVKVQGDISEDLYVRWTALTSCAGSYRIIHGPAGRTPGGGGGVDVHLLGGFDRDLVEGFQQPWQLVVSCRGNVSGMPNSSLQGGMMLVQNHAARAAGWTIAQGAHLLGAEQSPQTLWGLPPSGAPHG